MLGNCEADGIELCKPEGDSDRDRDHDPEEYELEDLYDSDKTAIFDGDVSEDDQAPDSTSVPQHKLFRAIFDYCPKPEGRSNLV